MKIDIYKSAKSGDKYLSVVAGAKLQEIDFPDSLDADLLELSPFRTRLEIDKAKDHSALQHLDILEQIEKNGFAVHGVKTTIDLRKK